MPSVGHPAAAIEDRRGGSCARTRPAADQHPFPATADAFQQTSPQSGDSSGFKFELGNLVIEHRGQHTHVGGGQGTVVPRRGHVDVDSAVLSLNHRCR